VAEAIALRAMATIVVRASPEKVFDAWLDPAKAANFLAAGDTVAKDIEIDAREGGAFRIVMSRQDVGIEHRGRYVLIDRPHRLIFTWLSPATDWRLSLVTVTFTKVEGGVRVDLEHEGLPNSEQAQRHKQGWDSILWRLANHVD
jgi:uncharacterized protein YndB with AHSA1/START domain